MSCTQSAAGISPHRHRPRPAPAEAAIRRAARALGRRLEAAAFRIARNTQRRALARLDDHLLNDIGVTPEEAAREAAKPFWRD